MLVCVCMCVCVCVCVGVYGWVGGWVLVLIAVLVGEAGHSLGFPATKKDNFPLLFSLTALHQSHLLFPRLCYP